MNTFKFALLFLCFSLNAKTVESVFLPFQAGENTITKELDIDVPAGSYFNFKLTGLDFSNYPEYTLDGAELVLLGGDELSFITTKDFSKGEVIEIKVDKQLIVDNVYFGLKSIQTPNGSSFYTDEQQLFEVIDTLRLEAGDGKVELVSDADLFIEYYHVVEFDVSDRERFKYNSASINSPMSFDPIVDEMHLDYLVTISNAKLNGKHVDIGNQYLFSIKSTYNTYTVNYGYHIQDNPSWYTFYKLQNNSELKADVYASIFLSSTKSGESDIQRFDVSLGELQSLSGLNLSGGDLVKLTGANDDNYHINVTFHTSNPIAVASQNASPSGRTVNVVE